MTRHVWTLSSALLGAASLVVLGQQRTIVGVAVCWVAAQVCFNAALATLTAAIPDRVPVAQRGGVSGWVGIPHVDGCRATAPSLAAVLGVILSPRADRTPANSRYVVTTQSFGRP